jgi:hypothetical protein
MFEKIVKIIEVQVGDGFTGEDYDRGWQDAAKRIAHELADYFRSENPFFDRQAFLKACGFSSMESWKAVPYNDETELSNRFAVATIVDVNGDIIADVFSRDAATLIEIAPMLKKKLLEYEKDEHR